MTGNELKIKDGILAFTQDLHVPKAYQNDPTKPKKYRTKILLPKDHKQLPEIFAEIHRLAVETWGKADADRVLASIKNNNQKMAFGDGDLTKYEGFKGHYFISASRRESDGKPLYVRANPGTKENPNIITEQSGELYSGAHVNAHVSFWTWTKSGDSMNCNLLGLQFYRPGTRISGGSPAASVDEFGNEEPDEPTIVGAGDFKAFM